MSVGHSAHIFRRVPATCAVTLGAIPCGLGVESTGKGLVENHSTKGSFAKFSAVTS